MNQILELIKRENFTKDEVNLAYTDFIVWDTENIEAKYRELIYQIKYEIEENKSAVNKILESIDGLFLEKDIGKISNILDEMYEVNIEKKKGSFAYNIIKDTLLEEFKYFKRNIINSFINKENKSFTIIHSNINKEKDYKEEICINWSKSIEILIEDLDRIKVNIIKTNEEWWISLFYHYFINS